MIAVPAPVVRDVPQKSRVYRDPLPDHHRCRGRISAASAFVGTTLKVKPILEINRIGCLQLVDKRRGRNKSIQTLLGYYQNEHREPGIG